MIEIKRVQDYLQPFEVSLTGLWRVDQNGKIAQATTWPWNVTLSDRDRGKGNTGSRDFTEIRVFVRETMCAGLKYTHAF